MRTALLLLAVCSISLAAVEVRDLEVMDGGLPLPAKLALPAAPGKRPGVLVVHEWWGRNDYAIGRARELADLGYAALAADAYGLPPTQDFQEAARRAQAFYADPSLFAKRLEPALAALRARPEVDPERIAAIGFCFGGSAVLQLARGGSDLRAVVAFHPGLGTAAKAAPGQVKARVVVMHGGADPFVPPAQVTAFADEMLAAGAAWELRSFPGAVHAFTNPLAGQGVENIPAGVPFAQAVRHDASAEAGAMRAMREVLAAAFSR